MGEKFYYGGKNFIWRKNSPIGEKFSYVGKILLWRNFFFLQKKNFWRNFFFSKTFFWWWAISGETKILLCGKNSPMWEKFSYDGKIFL